jgi:hypothetical protein
MKVYLAARYSRRLELCVCRAEFARMGIEVTSRWLDGNHQLDDNGVPIGEHGEALVEDGHGAEAAELRAKFALDDYQDVLAADVLIAFTEPPRSDKGRGGRHVEFGIALGAGRQIVVIGPRENIFTWLPTVDHFDTWGEFFDYWLPPPSEASP